MEKGCLARLITLKSAVRLSNRSQLMTNLSEVLRELNKNSAASIAKSLSKLPSFKMPEAVLPVRPRSQVNVVINIDECPECGHKFKV